LKHHCLIIVAAMLIVAGGASGSDGLSKLVDSALKRAGDNAAELRAAIDKAPGEQKEGVWFLIAHMPKRDLTGLSADFLLKNVAGAYLAWNKAPWKARISKEMFLNDVLPYASINERRDDWREDFYKRFAPLVAKAKTPGEAAIIINEKISATLGVRFSRKRPKADQSPYETMKAGLASCSGLTVLMVDACRAVGVPARFAGTPLWTNKSGNHSWVEIWDGEWHYTGAAEPAGGKLDKAWFTKRATTAQKDHRLHAIYATSFKPTGITFPLVWDSKIDYVHAVNVTARYVKPDESKTEPKDATAFDVEASLHAIDQLGKYLQTAPDKRPTLAEQGFATVALTAKDARKAQALLWSDHVKRITQTRAAEMKARVLTAGDVKMPFFYSVAGDKPKTGRSLYVSLHGGGGAPKRVNDQQWNNQKRLYKVPEGVYVAPRAPTDAWNMWHKPHIDVLFDRLIENLIVFEGVDPNRVYVMGYSAGGDGVYRLAPRMADRWAAASMMAGHPGGASALNLRNTPFSIHVGGRDAAYKRNKVAREWAEKLDKLQKGDPKGYVHWAPLYESYGHWLKRKDAAAIPWMAKYTRNPLPGTIVWRQDSHQRFYWLATSKPQPGTVVRAELKAQTITLESTGATQLIIRLNDQMLDLDKPVTVKSGDKKLHNARVIRSIKTLAKTLAQRGDPKSTFSAEITVTMSSK
jgi:poly(3-hydroxybutyrate) depolymerase